MAKEATESQNKHADDTA